MLKVCEALRDNTKALVKADLQGKSDWLEGQIVRSVDITTWISLLFKAPVSPELSSHETRLRLRKLLFIRTLSCKLSSQKSKQDIDPALYNLVHACN